MLARPLARACRGIRYTAKQTTAKPAYRAGQPITRKTPMPLTIPKTSAKPIAAPLPQTLQTCLDKLLRAEMAHPAPDARAALCDARQKLHVALVDVTRLGRLVAALRERVRASPESGFAALDAEHAENRRVKALAHALDVARDCDHLRRGWEETTAVNDNGAAS
jgi:hypothetical protein